MPSNTTMAQKRDWKQQQQQQKSLDYLDFTSESAWYLCLRWDTFFNQRLSNVV